MDLKLPRDEAHGLNRILWTALSEAMRELHEVNDNEEWKRRIRSRMQTNYSAQAIASLAKQSEARGVAPTINEETVKLGMEALETAMSTASLYRQSYVNPVKPPKR